MLKRFLLCALVFVTGNAMAADLGQIVHKLDPGAEIQHSGTEATIVTTAQRVTPHDPPFTKMIPALCDSPSSLEGLDKVIVLNVHGAKGVEFWTYDETDDLVGTCERVADGTPIQGYAVMH